MMSARTLLKKTLFQVFKYGPKVGLYISPCTYYAANHNILELENTRQFWAKKSDLPGIDCDIECQVNNLKKYCLPFKSEYVGATIVDEAFARKLGPGYGKPNFDVTYSFIRTLKPKVVIEVGSGVSTFGMARALHKNMEETGFRSKFISIEPYPYKALLELDGLNLIRSPVQQVSLETFSQLNEGDFLFIDSSHTVKPGGDVNFLILEVLPRLNPGVVVHFDDIHLPFDHGPAVLADYYHWAETSLLRAFLINNQKAEIILSLRHIYVERLQQLMEVLPDLEPGELSEEGLYPDSYGAFEYPPGDRPGAIFIRIK
jgi:predicted O-methyltransferase YrrM